MQFDKSQAPLYRFLRNLKIKERSYSQAQINHYMIKSYDSFYFKRVRGRGWGEAPRHDDAFFMAASEAATEFDDSILKHSALLHARYEALIAIPEIAAAHKAQVENYQRRIQAIHEGLLGE